MSVIYEHGVKVTEKPTATPSVEVITAGVQFVVGTAAVNQVKEVAVNKPILINNIKEAKEKLGYNNDMSFTANQIIFANFELFKVAPFVFVNVLDPAKHKKPLAEQTYTVTDKTAIIEHTGIIDDTTLVVKKMPEDAVLNKGTDYTLSFNDDGHLVIVIMGGASGVGQLKVKGNMLDVTKVTTNDVIGTYTEGTNERTGLECIEAVYPRYNLIPSMILAPGFSKEANVAMAMANKCEGINGMFRAECLIDLDTARINGITDIDTVKKSMLLDNPHQFVFYPMVKSGEKVLYYSAVAGAKLTAMTKDNYGTPEEYLSNKKLGLTAVCDATGKEIDLAASQANQINGYGVITAIRTGGEIVAWGVETAAYPKNKDVKDRFTGIRRMFTYVDNAFILFAQKYADAKMGKVAVDSLIVNFNIFGNSLVANFKIAGLYVERLEEDNTIESILDGELNVRLHLAAYPPIKVINGNIEYNYEPVVIQFRNAN